MAHFDELYPGRFLKGTQLAVPRVIRITSIDAQDLETEDGGVEPKAVLRYTSATGPGEVVWCKTNAILTAAVLGTEDHTAWGGHLITIYHDPSVMFGRERVGGVRVYGSPELADATVTVQIKRPRRKRPDSYTLRRTDTQGHVPDQAQPDLPDEV